MALMPGIVLSICPGFSIFYYSFPLVFSKVTSTGPMPGRGGTGQDALVRSFFLMGIRTLSDFPEDRKTEGLAGEPIPPRGQAKRLQVFGCDDTAPKEQPP